MRFLAYALFIILLCSFVLSAPTQNTPILTATAWLNLTGYNQTSYDSGNNYIANNWCFYNNSIMQGCRFYSDVKSFYPFDETGDVRDYTGNADGSIHTALTVAGQVFNSLNYSGSDYVDLGNAKFLNVTAYTLTLWIKCNSPSESNPAIFGETGASDMFFWYACEGASDTVRISTDTDTWFTGKGNLYDLNWHFLALSQSSLSNRTLFIDGVSQGTDTNFHESFLTTSTNIGKLPPYSQFFQGRIDEFQYYQRALSQNEITNMYRATKYGVTSNGGIIYDSKYVVMNQSWIFQVQPFTYIANGTAKNSSVYVVGSPTFTYQTSGSLLNFSYTNIINPNISQPSVLNQFYTAVKLYTSLNNSNIPNVNCSFNATNISAVFSYVSFTNITINSSNPFSLAFSENNASMISDRISFTACKTGGFLSLDIYGDAVPLVSYPASSFPICGATSFFSYITTALNNRSYSNITLQCIGCSGGSVKLIYTSNISASPSVFNVYRRFSLHEESNLANLGDTYAYIDNPYTYETAGNYTINHFCNATTGAGSTSFQVFNLYPNLYLANINNNTFYGGITIEAIETYNFTFSTNTPYDSVSINISFNGTVLSGNNAIYFSTTSKMLNKTGLYNISAVISNAGNYGYFNSYFYINDTSSPIIYINSPSGSYSINDTIPFDITAYDSNLYGVNISVYDALGKQVYSSEVTGISGTTYNSMFGLKFNSTGIYNLTVMASDSHTANSISAMKLTGSDNEITFNDKIKLTADIGAKLSASKEKDRYTIKTTYDKTAPAIKSFKVTSNCKLAYLPNSEHVAHLVDWCNKLWIDFDGTGENPTVTQEADNIYTVTFTTDKTELSFKSIGGLNTASSTVLFTVNPAIINPYSSDALKATQWVNTDVINPTTTAGILVIFFLFCIWVVLLIIGFILKLPIMFILDAIYGFTLAIVFISTISIMLGIIFLIVNVFLMLFAFIFTKEN